MYPFIIRHPNGVGLDLLIQPGASKNTVVGVHDQRLKIKIAAPPVDGKANMALITYIAKLFGIPRSGVILCRGEGSRRKQVTLSGISPEAVAEILKNHLV